MEDNRKELESEYGEVLSTDELQGKYKVIGFMMGFVAVEDKETGKRGSLNFQHMPRYYYNFVEEQ